MANERFTSLEICAGAGGQALGLEQAGFHHAAVVEIDNWASQTLRDNRGEDGPLGPWDVMEMDVHDLDGYQWRDEIDLFAGGVPCPPFSIAGKQLGADDERDLFPQALRLVDEINPKAVMLENVKGLGQKRFDSYRNQIIEQLEGMGYTAFWKLLQAADFGVPQLRPRFILVAVKHEYEEFFTWPQHVPERTTVGEALGELMAENGWPGAKAWAKQANDIGPTLVGGSKKHGGPDVGPTRAREAWKKLGVKGSSIAPEAPSADFPTDPAEEMPRLTVKMGGVIQGFPQDWQWAGGKTAQWRQVGNAFPPPVARAIGAQIKKAICKQPLRAGEEPAQPTVVLQPQLL
ncbi:DNA cytosine methyltransferase [Corynebacterium camporealensis]|uniref:Cytosine-specific methyltransferase n=1 Tax=Corynebacterium camporealensis TaxID=161896 RepID=A0A0F6TB70_9CORY|nr:DNA cytosine methyltransferase [Corynebacterium camporealensis]AKE38911.1 DNA-methyltransferase Dcm [Corynebacterium camporealensis]